MTPLQVEIHRWAATPFDWGGWNGTDCMLAPADWVARVTGCDVAASVRRTYHDLRSCERATGFFSDPVAAAARYFEGVGGLRRANVAAAGDVAVVRRIDDPRLPSGAMWLGECWALKGPSGATTLHPRLVRPLAIWSVGHAA